MNENDIKFIYHEVYKLLLPIMRDFIDCGKVTNTILDDVVEDIVETADLENYNSEDVRIAVARTIKHKWDLD